MGLRIVAVRFFAALAVAGLASAALPAQAQADCSPCGITAPVPQVVYVPQVQYGYGCGHCGNRGLFTSTWSSCGYEPCQPIVSHQTYYRSSYEPHYDAPEQTYRPETPYTEDDDDDGYTPYRYRHRFDPGYRYRRDITVHRRTFTNTRRTQPRQCGMINGKWTCVDRTSQLGPNRLTQAQLNRRTIRY